MKNTSQNSNFCGGCTTTAERYGTQLLQDIHFQDEMADFVRRKIPERVVAPKGIGAFGTFRVTADVSGFTRLSLLQRVGNTCKVFVRLSSLTVAGNGSTDTAHDIKGFAVRFYTEDGLWDLVGQSTPIFFLKDPAKFPQFMDVLGRDPRTGLHNPTAFWNFCSQNPETLYQTLRMFSREGLPLSYSAMTGYGVHTFSMSNENGECTWVKFSLRPAAEGKNLAENQTLQEHGRSGDLLAKQLIRDIEEKNFPKWMLAIQTMNEEQAREFRWNPFDPTKVWPEENFPWTEVGELILNELPDDHSATTERAAFSPANLPDGVGLSPDPLLIARLRTYADAQRHRIGAHFNLLPVNIGAAANNRVRHAASAMPHRCSLADAAQAYDQKETSNYYRKETEDDHFTQAGTFYTSLSEHERLQLTNALTDHLSTIEEERKKQIISRQLCYFFRADIELGMRIAQGTGVELDVNTMAHAR